MADARARGRSACPKACCSSARWTPARRFWRAVASEANVSFFSILGSVFVGMFVGVGASRVRDLFEQSKIIDEIDAVGHHRGAGLDGGHDEREQTRD